MNDMFPIVFILAVLVFLIGNWIFTGKFDCERITKHIEDRGGKVLAIERNYSGWFGRRDDRTYDVSYITPRDQKITATCKTSISTGVYWLSNEPPDGFGGPM